MSGLHKEREGGRERKILCRVYVEETLFPPFVP